MHFVMDHIVSAIKELGNQLEIDNLELAEDHTAQFDSDHGDIIALEAIETGVLISFGLPMAEYDISNNAEQAMKLMHESFKFDKHNFVLGLKPDEESPGAYRLIATIHLSNDEVVVENMMEAIEKLWEFKEQF